MKIIIFANAIHTNTLSGGDKIFVECAKRWTDWGHHVTVVTNEAGEHYCLANGLHRANIRLWSSSWFDTLGYVLSNFIKIFTSLFYSVNFHFDSPDIIFASSFFLPDVLPALFLKVKNQKATFVTASYIFTKEPFGRDYSGGKFKGLLFWLNQIVSLSIVGKFGSKALTASEADRHRFAELRHMKEENVLSVRGGVDNAFFQEVQKQDKKYDAVFVGRFHPQKCIPELITIWEQIVDWDHTRVLALVGGGIQERFFKKLIQSKNLEKNVVFLGMQDGVQKAKILKSSHIFVTTSRFDTGNIALDEGLACGLPGILYDLPHLDYPSGVIKVPIGDDETFVKSIKKLLTDKEYYEHLSSDALSFAKTIDWDIKVKSILDFLVD